MSKTKVLKTAFICIEKKSREWPAIVYFWLFGLTIVSYVNARATLDGQPHPYHWAAGLIGGIVGIPRDWLWYRWRGDVF